MIQILLAPIISVVQSAKVIEDTDRISVEEKDSSDVCPG